jgi:hypothetical protein
MKVVVKTIKEFSKGFPFIRRWYAWIKERPLPQFSKPSFFYNCSHNHDACCFILAGYKEFLWDIVFDRLKRFAPDNIDVCIVSSGLFSRELQELAKSNKWSYLCTKRNSVTLALNTAIQSFPFAQYIYKIDEDIFLTKNFFLKLRSCYARCEQDSEYFPAFVAPLIPVNGYGHLRILKKFSSEYQYEKLFEKPKYSHGSDRMIENDPKSAKYFWGEGDDIPELDVMDAILGGEDFSFSVCPVRFSIGAIFFTRKIWGQMGFFTVVKGNNMGRDEVQLCSLAAQKSLAIIVCENTVVGHLSFGKQNSAMKDYFLSYPERFMVKDTSNI